VILLFSYALILQVLLSSFCSIPTSSPIVRVSIVGSANTLRTAIKTLDVIDVFRDLLSLRLQVLAQQTLAASERL